MRSLGNISFYLKTFFFPCGFQQHFFLSSYKGKSCAVFPKLVASLFFYWRGATAKHQHFSAPKCPTGHPSRCWAACVAYPTSNVGMLKWKAQFEYKTRLAPICTCSVAVSADFSASELSWKFIKVALLVGYAYISPYFWLPHVSSSSTSSSKKKHESKLHV